MNRLKDKVAVITGAAGGIGLATAELFAAEGAHVVGVDLREHEVGELSLTADLTDEQTVIDLYKTAREHFGRIDVLFNNAGISPTDDDSVLRTGIDAWQRVQDANLKSVFFCCKYGIPHLLENGSGLSRSWARRRHRSPTPPQRAACWRCLVRWGSSSPGAACA
jgi:NAD(P)-dependent dehydrogenase (short-subunit alcohol dehydrogenase family)